MNALQTRLDAESFFLISRSVLVNLDCVVEVCQSCAATANIVLLGGIRLEVSRRRLKYLLERLAGSPA